ncbi:hypothetical protein [Chryseosolibacter indicus]|uniref:G/U mismatch-specific uracil-DNA glycosylase n=1 Tax=Chryseosolibacter indicus TaxID=2782351 RepID=A0ABS5VY48_9BACT|nr:hypothetical protein [Chryseosolibacter indicus]MBT1706332.1 hypothetical protein [Chryseosolibacter indicus]
MVTTHQYIKQFPIKKSSVKLILGTIHPHDHTKFLLPFFYGNEMTLWKILNSAFPNTFELTVEGIKNFLDERKIAISDTIIECTRKKPTALDEDLIPVKLNEELIPQIRDSNIKEVLFTSGFGKNNAFTLFYENILGLKITKEIKEARGVVLKDTRFGRPIQLTVLYSPSGTSNVGLSKSQGYLANAHKYVGLKTPVKQFKIDYFKEKFTSNG